MENNLQVFNYNDSAVRTVQKDGEPWFVLKDVCGILKLGTPAKVAKRLDDDEKGVTQIHSLGGNQRITIISESGLYSVILRSDKPEAKPFRKWITSEVIPSIRKHGAYLSPEALEAASTDPNYLPQLVSALKSENLALEAKIKADAAKVMLVESACREPVSVEQFADFVRRNTNIKVSGESLFRSLRKSGYLSEPYSFPTNENSPYFQIVERTTALSDGYVSVHRQLKLTPEGQLFFLDRILSAKGGQNA